MRIFKYIGLENDFYHDYELFKKIQSATSTPFIDSVQNVRKKFKDSNIVFFTGMQVLIENHIW